MTRVSGISVVIPVFNGENHLAEAVASVQSQTPGPLEIIVVDDGSTDGTAEVARQLGFGVQYYHQPNRGPSSARNLGIKRSRGDLLAFLDADDLWPADRLRLQLARLEQDPELEIILGRIQVTGDLTPRDHLVCFDGPDRTMTAVNLGSGLFRRSVFDRVGLLDESLPKYEDHDWFLRARELETRMVILDEVTLQYRRRRDSLSQQQTSGVGMLSVLRGSLERRRRRHGVAPELRRFQDHRETAGRDGIGHEGMRKRKTCD